MDEFCDESNHCVDEKCSFLKNEDDLWNNTSSQFYASTDFYNNNFTNMSDIEREDTNFIKKSIKYFSVFDENPIKNPLIDNTVKINKNTYFVINKRHSYKCKHLTKISKSLRKNKIKLSLEDDFKKLFSNHFQELMNNFIILKNFISPIKTFDKNSKNRNFRLFDKDVIIKKIISHFYKFSSCMINFIEREFNLKAKLNDSIKQKKRSQSCFRKILWMKICEFDEKYTNICLPEIVMKVTSLSILDIYKYYFLNSHYFQEITNSFKNKYGDLYYQYFINICSEFPEFIFKNIKYITKQQSNK